jgi:hypothetical protein
MLAGIFPIKPDTRIDEVVNENFSKQGNGAQRRLITDSLLHIDGSTYHIECQSLPDGTILVRMFEYDLAVGIKESRYVDYHLTVDIPVSGVLFLRSTKNIPDEMKVTINTVGGHLEYPVATLKLSDYTLDDLIKKDLLFLFPFYIFNLEKELKGFDEKEESRTKVISSVSELLDYVNGLSAERKLAFDKYMLLTDMIQKVADHLSAKYSSARKELDDIMGGKIIEYKGERIFNEGREQGREEGREQGREEGREEGREQGREEGRKEERNERNLEVATEMLKAGNQPISFISKISQLSEPEIKKLAKKLNIVTL